MSLLNETVNPVTVDRNDEGKPEFRLNGEKLGRMRGYKVQAVERAPGLAWVTVEFMSNDVSLYGHAPTHTHSEHVDEAPPSVPVQDGPEPHEHKDWRARAHNREAP